MQISRNEGSRAAYFVLIFSISFIIGVLTGFKLILECHEVSKESTSFIVLEYLYVFLLLGVSMFTMAVFIYSASFFPRLFFAQNPNIPASDLKKRPNPAKILNRDEDSTLNTNQLQAKTTDISQMVGPNGRQYSEREYREAQ